MTTPTNPPPTAPASAHNDHPLRHWDRTCPACAQLAEGERDRFIAAMRAQGCPDTWAFQDDGTGGFHNQVTEWAWIAWRAALDSQAAELARLRTENANLKTVMVAAAEEIAAHWNAHCDSEGYGPQNLMRRLEEGIPSEYGYTAGRFAELQAELAALRASAASVQADQRAELDRLRIRCAAYEEAYGIAYKATYQSHNGHWDSTMRGGAGCPECIRAREARENCDVALRNGLSALAALADKGEGAPPAPGGAA